MGIGIAAMHYIGMTALHASAHLEHGLGHVIASVAVGIAASGLALWLAGGRRGRPPLILSACALGVAIAGMHYTAMAGLTVFPHPAPGDVSGGAAISTDLLASVVAIVAFLVSGSFLLALVPDRAKTEFPFERSPSLYSEYEAGWWSYPPKDYAKWGGLVAALAQHCLERYGAEVISQQSARKG